MRFLESADYPAFTASESLDESRHGTENATFKPIIDPARNKPVTR
jgi:hypothetical protein